MQSVSERRSYHSPLREQQAEQTRALILDTLAEMVAEDGFDGIVVKDLAARAGMAERTVYRHFPDRDALHDALADRVAAQVGWTAEQELPADPATWGRTVADAYARFDEQIVPTTVVAKLNAVRTRPAAESVRRGDRFRATIAAAYPAMTDEEHETVLAAIQVLASSRTWLRLREEMGLDGPRASATMRWLVELLVADLDERGGLPSYGPDEEPVS